MKKLFCFLLLVSLMLSGCGASPGASQPLPAQQAPVLESLTVTFLNVGRADCALLEIGEYNVLIDTGLDKTGDEISAFLKARGVTHLDILLLTHMDKDHIGGADIVLDNVTVARLIAPSYDKGNKQYEEYVQALAHHNLVPENLTAPLTLSLSDATLTFLPAQKTQYEQSNDYSILLEVTHGIRMLFAGDAETERLSEYITRDARTQTLIKMPHHGRKDNLTNEFLQAITPQFAIITDSEKDPAEESVLGMLTALDVGTYSTHNGNITVTSDGTSIHISQ